MSEQRPGEKRLAQLIEQANPTLQRACREELRNKKLKELLILVLEEHPDWDLLKACQYVMNKLKEPNR